LSALFILPLVGEMAFSSSCQFLAFWRKGSDSKSKAVVKAFICDTKELALYQVYIWNRRLAPHRRNQRGAKRAMPPKISSICHFVLWEAVFQTKYSCSLKSKDLPQKKFWAGYATVTKVGRPNTVRIYTANLW